MANLDDLSELIARHSREGRTETVVPHLGLTSVHTPMLPRKMVYEPFFCIVAQGSKEVLLGDQVFRYGAGNYLIVSLDLPVTSKIREASRERPLLSVTLDLKPRLLADVLLSLPDEFADGAPTTGLAVSDLSDDLLDPMVRLLRLIETPRDIAVLAPLIEREILYRLMCGEQSGMLRQIALADSRMSQIARAIGWIRSNYAETLRVEALAGLAGMSASSFHRHFKAATAMSPLQFQKQIRLQEARKLMLAEKADAARVGFAVGYESPSQFSREYSRFFGAPPARDAAQLRENPAAYA